VSPIRRGAERPLHNCLAQLRDERALSRADLAVNLHGRGPQSTALLAATGPRRLVAYGATARWRADEHEVRRWCRLLDEAGMPADPTDLALARPPVAPLAEGALLVHPGAAQPSRRWPVERWAAVARELAASGASVLLTGGPGERERALQVAAAAALPPSAVVAGRTSPLELAALVAAARLLVSVDTGVAHLATACGTPSVVLFGPTDPALWGPPADRPRHRVLWAGRTGDNFAPSADPGLLLLDAGAVLAACRDALQQEPAARTSRTPQGGPVVVGDVPGTSTS